MWYEIKPTILEKYQGYELLIKDYRFVRDEWHERNRIMADNIMKATKEYPGKRLVVLTGATHRYILRDLLKEESSIDLKEYWEVIDFDLEKHLESIKPFVVNVGISVEGLTHEEASVRVSKEYWQAVIKRDWKLVDKLRPPVGKDWRDHYADNPPVELVEVKQAYWPEGGGSSGPLVPCVVKFKDGRMKEIKMVPFFRKINGKTLCYIAATWGKHLELE